MPNAHEMSEKDSLSWEFFIFIFSSVSSLSFSLFHSGPCSDCCSLFPSVVFSLWGKKPSAFCLVGHCPFSARRPCANSKTPAHPVNPSLTSQVHALSGQDSFITCLFWTCSFWSNKNWICYWLGLETYVFLVLSYIHLEFQVSIFFVFSTRLSFGGKRLNYKGRHKRLFITGFQISDLLLMRSLVLVFLSINSFNRYL